MQEESFTIREAIPDDAPGIAKVHIDTWRSSYSGIIPDSYLEEMSYERAEGMWRERITASEPSGLIYIGESPEAGIVGFATGGAERTGKYPYEGEIYAIYVLTQFQGRGIGSRLTSTIARQLGLEGFRSLLIWVLKENPARGFYKKLGGKIVAEREIEIAGVLLPEVGYGWKDISKLTDVTT
jgi:ribosomal protein S18 acetylase RimI-like enzyme